MLKKHNLLWFKNRIGKKVYCDDHYRGVCCMGILIENELVVDNLLESQNKRGIRFTNHCYK